MKVIGGASPERKRFRIDLFVTAQITSMEIVANFQGGRIIALFSVMTFLFLLSGHVLALDLQRRNTSWEINRLAQSDPSAGGLVKYQMRDGSFIYNLGTLPNAPIQRPQPMSVIIRGMDLEVDRAVTIGQRISFGPREDEDMLIAGYNVPDMGFVVKTCVSLLALFFSLGLVTREKEAGTLRALLAHPVRRQEFLLGKVAGAFLSLFTSFAVPFFIGIAYLFFFRGLLRGQSEMTRVWLILAMSLLYGLSFVFLGLLISTITTQTKTALVIALLSWGIIVLVLPNAAVLAAKVFSPAPSYDELNARLYLMQQEITQSALASHPGAQSVFDLPNAREIILQTMQEDRRLTDDFLARQRDQMIQARWLAEMSPAGALTFGLSDLAGTGVNDHQSYMNFLVSGRDQIIEAFTRESTQSPGNQDLLVRQTLDEVNSREHQPVPLQSSLRASIVAFLSLAIWTGMTGLIAFWRFANYKVN